MRSTFLNILILGAGYVGTKLADQLLKKSFHVTLTTRSSENTQKLKNQYKDVLQLDCSDQKSVEKSLQYQDVLVICVAPSHGCSYEDTYLATTSAIKKSIQNTSKLKQIIYISSTSVYGDQQGNITNEAAPLLCTSDNGKILIQAEKQILSLQEKCDTCIFRSSGIYGPGREPSNYLRAKLPDPLSGDKNSPTNMIHIDDLVSAIAFAIDGKLSGIFNICDNDPITRADFYEKLAQIHHLQVPSFDPNLPQFHGGSRIISSKKIQSKGFKLKYPNRLFL